MVQYVLDTEKDDESSGFMDIGGEAPEDIVGRDSESSGFMDMGGEAPEDIVTPAPHETTPPSSLTEELRPNNCNVSLVQMDHESTTVSVLTISSAHMERSANFTCYARNDVGNGNGSVELLVTGTYNLPLYKKLEGKRILPNHINCIDTLNDRM